MFTNTTSTFFYILCETGNKTANINAKKRKFITPEQRTS